MSNKKKEIIIDYPGLARILKAIAHPVRLQIIHELSVDERVCVSDLSERLKVRQPTISQSLNILRNAGIVDCQREGNKSYFFLKVDCLQYLIGLCQEARDEKER